MRDSISMKIIILLTSFTVVSGFGSALAHVTDWVNGKVHESGGDIEAGNLMKGRFCAKEGDHNYCLCKGTALYGYLDLGYIFMGAGKYRGIDQHHSFNGAHPMGSIDPFHAPYGSDLMPNYGGHLDRCNNAHFGDPNRSQVKDCTCSKGGNQDSFIPRLKFFLEGKSHLCLAHTELRDGGRVELRPYNYANYGNCAWDYDGSTGLIRASGSNYCLDAHNRHTQGLHLHLWTCSKTKVDILGRTSWEILNGNQDWLVEIKEVPTGSGTYSGTTAGHLRQRRSNFLLEPKCLESGCQVQLWTEDTYDGFAYSQCKTSNTQYPGDRTDNPIFGGGGFDMRGTAAACQTKCEDPNTKDSHGRQCVAVEHSSQDPHAVAHCAFAWDCSEIGHWGGGKVYRRKSINEPHMQRWNVGSIPCLSWDAQLGGPKTCRCHANGGNNYTCNQRRQLEEHAEEEKVEDALDEEKEKENNATVNKKKESTERRKQ